MSIRALYTPHLQDGSKPVINAIFFLLIVGTSLLAMVNLYFGKKEA